MNRILISLVCGVALALGSGAAEAQPGGAGAQGAQGAQGAGGGCGGGEGGGGEGGEQGGDAPGQQANAGAQQLNGQIQNANQALRASQVPADAERALADNLGVNTLSEARAVVQEAVAAADPETAEALQENFGELLREFSRATTRNALSAGDEVAQALAPQADGPAAESSVPAVSPTESASEGRGVSSGVEIVNSILEISSQDGAPVEAGEAQAALVASALSDSEGGSVPGVRGIGVAPLVAGSRPDRHLVVPAAAAPRAVRDIRAIYGNSLAEPSRAPARSVAVSDGGGHRYR